MCLLWSKCIHLAEVSNCMKGFTCASKERICSASAVLLFLTSSKAPFAFCSSCCNFKRSWASVPLFARA